VPARLRPTAPIAADAVLVGDPGRALALAQVLLAAPKMSNHARGLWGYSGETPGGRPLTLQSTGMGGPSAALVLADLGELGVRRAVRVGTCAAIDPGLEPAELLFVTEAHAWGGPGGGGGAAVFPDAELAAALRSELGGAAQPGAVASLDILLGHEGAPAGVDADAADMQTAALFARGAALGVAIAAVLVVAETVAGGRISDEAAEPAVERAGRAAAAVLAA